MLFKHELSTLECSNLHVYLADDRYPEVGWCESIAVPPFAYHGQPEVMGLLPHRCLKSLGKNPNIVPMTCVSILEFSTRVGMPSGNTFFEMACQSHWIKTQTLCQ